MKTIFCIQSVVGSGHHNTYAAMYCEILAELGYRVVLLCNGPKRTLTKTLDEFEKQGRFTPVWGTDKNDRKKTAPPPVHARGFVRRVMSFSWRWVRKFAMRIDIVLPPFRLDHSGPAWPSPEFLSNVEREYAAPDFLFFLYLDEYISRYPDLLCNLQSPWTGLLFNAALVKSETGYYVHKALQTKACIGLCFLYPQYLAHYKKRFPQKQFISLPDVPDSSLSAQEPAFCEKIRTIAAGRSIVMLAGSLAARKGMVSLLRTAALLQGKPYCFVFCGKFSWEAFGECTNEDSLFLRQTLSNPPENCLFYLTYIENEGVFNHVFRIADIVFAVYEGFDLSSGIVGKAAVFRKPILVQSGGVMEKLVMSGPFGEAVLAGDPQAIAMGLERIRNRTTSSYVYDTYASTVSREALRQDLGQFLESAKPNTIMDTLCPPL